MVYQLTDAPPKLGLRFFVLGALTALLAKLVDFKFIVFLFTAHLVIVFVLAGRASQGNGYSFVGCHLSFP